MSLAAAFSSIVASGGCSVCKESGLATETEEPWDGVKVTDNSPVDIYSEESELINAPTVVCDLTDKAVLERLTKGEQRPTNVILRLSAKYNVLDTEGNKIDSFAHIYDTVLKGRIIPILYVSDEAAAQAADALLSERFDLLDAAVMSDRPELVESLRKTHTKIRGIVRYKEFDEPAGLVHVTNKSLANVVLLDREDADIETVRYVQARFKTVWVRSDSAQLIDLYDCINSGAYGVVCPDYEAVYRALGAYDYGISRMPFNAAHRGLPLSHNENSVSGTQAAVELGATHVELDAYLTTDNRIVMMHNEGIGATTNGSAMIEELSLAELRQYKLNRHQPEEDVPTLEDIIQVLKGTDVVLILEIKSLKRQLVDCLKRVLEEQNFMDQIVVISFNQATLGQVFSALPEIPTAFLGNFSEEQLANNLALMGRENFGVDTQAINTSVSFNEKGLKSRGIIGWYWTFSTLEDVTDAFKKGYTGLTTDVADSFSLRGSRIMYIKGGENADIPVLGAPVPLIGITYAGGETEITGRVYALKDMGDKYAVVASYTPPATGGESPTLYTQIFYISH